MEKNVQVEMKESWRNKIQLVQNATNAVTMLSENSIGIYIKTEVDNEVLIYLKPLNETFEATLFSDGEGILINFERDLIDEDDIEYALDVMSLFNKNPLIAITTIPEINQIRQVVALIEEEFNTQKASYIMLKTLLKVLLLQLIRFQNNGFLKQDLNQKRVFQFLELMETTFLKETNASYYASVIGISVKRLNQILQEKLSRTAKQIIQQRQITEAKRQLIRSQVTTKELAFMLSFDSVSSFSRFFKKNVGVSPSDFRIEK